MVPASLITAITVLANDGVYATVTAPAHGLFDGESATVAGASDANWNGYFPMKVVDANTLFYTMAAVPANTTLGTASVFSFKVQQAFLLADAGNSAAIGIGPDSSANYYPLAAGQSYTIPNTVNPQGQGSKVDLAQWYTLAVSGSQTLRILWICLMATLFFLSFKADAQPSGVQKLVAGSGVTLTPSSGVGVVTVTSSASGSGSQTPLTNNVNGAGNTISNAAFSGNGAGLTNLNTSRFTITNITLISDDFTNANGTLPAGWVKAGGGVAYCTNGNSLYVQSAGASTNDFQSLYNTNVYNASQNYTISFTASPVSVPTLSEGFGAGQYSGNAVDANSYAATILARSANYNGALVFYCGATNNTAANQVADTANASSTNFYFPFIVSTNYDITINRTEDVLTMTVSNQTTHAIESLAWRQTTVSGNLADGYWGTSGFPSFVLFGGEYIVTHFRYTVNPPQVLDWLIWGDSITGNGNSATTLSSSWGKMVADSFNQVGQSAMLFGSGSDRTVEFVKEVAVATNLSPRNVLFAGGGNDIGSSITSYLTNLNIIKTNFPNANFYFVTPSARYSQDMTPVVNYERTNFPAITIDVFGATKDILATTLKAAFNSGDGTHPNDLGHNVIKQKVRSDLIAKGVQIGDVGSASGTTAVSQTLITNVTAATSFTWVFPKPFVDTNYVATAIGNGIALASSFVSGKTVTQVTFNMTIATGTIECTATHK